MIWKKVEIIDVVHHLLETIPPGVIVVAAVKQRTMDEVETVVQAGITHIGHNYIQEAQLMVPTFGDKATWHMIGHLQRNKVAYAARLFDMIETLDSIRLAATIEGYCGQIGKIMPVLIEINSGREPNKTGILPEDAEDLIIAIADMEHIRVEGLMTMGPLSDRPEELRPYYRVTRQIFEHLSTLTLPNGVMRYLSMGMSDSYHIALEEGANIIRLGTKLFGPRNTKP
jgi:pyridoxal phosphate enzyme (YggS family)